MENIGIFTAIWYNLCPLGIVCGHLVHFSRFGMFGPRKVLQLCSRFQRKNKQQIKTKHICNICAYKYLQYF
jgi:ribosomal protein L37AE/L43A